MDGGILYANEATVAGGGIFNQSGTATFTTVSITSNTADGPNGIGGGVYAISGTIGLATCTVSDNACTAGAAYGGGSWWNGGTLILANSGGNNLYNKDPNSP